MVALLTSVRNSPCFGGLRRTKTCHWQLFARPSVLFGYFLHDAKSDNPFPCREHRGFANLESAHQNNDFAQTQLNPFAALGGIIFALRAIISGFAASFPPYGSVPAGTAHFVCFFAALGGDSFRLTAVSCCCRNIFCRLRRLSFLLRRKFVPAGTAHSVCFFVSFCLPQKEHKPVSCIGNGSQNRSLLCLGGIVRMIRILFHGLRTRK